jgi:hypothetical protein
LTFLAVICVYDFTHFRVLRTNFFLVRGRNSSDLLSLPLPSRDSERRRNCGNVEKVRIFLSLRVHFMPYCVFIVS